MLGFEVLNGWGLTETSPVLACRSTGAGNVKGTVGQVIPQTDVLIVDVESGRRLPDGEMGRVVARGPGVMGGGYYKDPEATRNAWIAIGPGLETEGEE